MKRNQLVGVMSLALVLVFGQSLFAENFSDRINPDIAKGVECHDSARGGDSKAGETTVDKSLSFLKPFIDSNEIACVYYGSALCIKASFLANKNPIKSLAYLKDGSNYLDKAVTMKPNDFYVHLIRLENGIEVSRTSPYKRYDVLKDDVAFLMNEKNHHTLSAEEKSEAVLYCAHYYLDSGDLDYALELFELALEIAPKSEVAKQAKKMLDKYSD